MNTEELDLSLRSEFENYLKAVVAEMRKETTEFQGQIEAEFVRHKEQLDEAFKAFSTRFDAEYEFDAAFTSSVSEHLRLAVDEGASIAATAMAEAEKLAPPPVEIPVAEPPPAPVYDVLRDAVKDISSKDSQSTILKALVHHAAEFAARGAFFIIKNEHFVGWKVFGADADDAESAIRDIQFSCSSDSILSTTVGSLEAVEGSDGAFAEDSAFLDPLNFGRPARMYAIPLVARGRGVAVLYADQGVDGTEPNIEALEMLVRVAGLTVELHASSQTAKTGQQAVADLENTGNEPEASSADEVPFETAPEETKTADHGGFAFSESVSFEGGFPQTAEEYSEPEPVAASPFVAVEEVEPVSESPFTSFDPVVESAPTADVAEAFEYQTFESIETVEVQPVQEEYVEPAEETQPAYAEAEFSHQSELEPEVTADPAPVAAFESDNSPFTSSPFDSSANEYAPAGVPSGGFEPAVETVVEAPAPSAPRARLSDRPVDLPIEVPEEERRSHNDARRFARLLVSEIKLYNEKKVTEGRESSDLYERLRDAIDRSREMYDKRVQPPVASKFDYFHYELVNSLAEGDDGRLGSGYPGSNV
ncbi:MAG: hypothetical protein WBO10_03785 [Pyrinomonadaceae bacterium]